MPEESSRRNFILVALGHSVNYTNASVSADGLYEYDALYRLVRAEGREHPGQQPADTDATLLRLDHPNDLEALVRYEERYRYDPAGNIEEIAHRRPSGAPSGWTRRYAYAIDSNRLRRTSLPGDAADELSASYTHDEAGNLTRMPHLALMRWDHADRLQATSRQVVTRGTPETTYYTYDAAGQRVRKVTETAAQDGATQLRKAERLYLGAHELFRAYSAQSLSEERQTLHIMDHETRLALAETATITPPIPGGPAPSASAPPETRLRYQLANHLSSATLELDETAQVISYEEYHPYGTTSLHAASTWLDVSPKRYRYTSKERDSETGFTYHGARYYAPWLARWTSPDPAGDVDGPNLYAYVRCRPIHLSDPSGRVTLGDQWIGGPQIDYKTRLLSGAMTLKLAKGFLLEARDTLNTLYGLAKNGPDAAILALGAQFLNEIENTYKSSGRGLYGAYEVVQLANPMFHALKFGFDTYEMVRHGDLAGVGRQGFKLFLFLAVWKASNLRGPVDSVGSGLVGNAHKYGAHWPKAELSKAIERHAGSDHTIWFTKSKLIFENPKTGRQVVLDMNEGYFRIFQPKTLGAHEGVYLDMMGKVPRPAMRTGGGVIKNVDLRSIDKGWYNRETHFWPE